MDLHDCITTGTLEELHAALNNGADVNASGRNGVTPLMAAIAAKDLDKMRLLLERGADPELTDDFNGAALRHAVDEDFVDGVRFLLELDVDRGYSPKHPLKPINFESVVEKIPATPLPDELKGLISEEDWKATQKSGRDLMLEMGKNPTVTPAISDVQSVAVLQLFLAAGDNIRLAPREVMRSYVGLENGGDFQASAKDYEENRSPRFGSANPDPMDNPFWDDMIRLGGSAYSARKHFDDTDALDSAVWCFDRFGTSVTPLPEGRFVQIGGEHEDFYDPDFCIYNDVVIHDGQGGFQILGYPRDVFPPTDFHTATLVEDAIFIVGCLGYTDQRMAGSTPVFRLAVDSWKIEPVTTSGDNPSWLHDHRATYDANRKVIRVEGGSILVEGEPGETDIEVNKDRHELDLQTFTWRKLD
ncbi:ankyrin repeat domain-containing protein [Botrimarina mediterranea]|uniref:ankyrin repeat domain-containing protein n=1 Tax=Botrimarina mediterranea TaxID=2528022 RepID=UPI00118808D7|nr:Ankyrin repeats (3 copies) [Planctomycetes bacterium K2D]